MSRRSSGSTRLAGGGTCAARGWLALVVALAVLPWPTTAVADEQPDHRLVWKESWRRFEVLDYGVTAAIAVELTLLEFVADSPEQPIWRGGILFDDWGREAFALRTPGGRNTAIEISDPLTILLQAYPVLDGIVVPLAFDDLNADLFWQISMINTQAILASGLLNRIAIRTVGRERPDAAPCREDREYSQDCRSRPNNSFFSGHTSGAFTGAALSCAHHSFLPLYGGSGWDRVACAVPVGLASIEGMLRVMADRHYLTDVMTGAAVGAAVGFGIPLLHYGYAEEDEAESAAVAPVAVVPVVSRDVVGVGLGGVL